jgi:hypothetical protein
MQNASLATGPDYAIDVGSVARAGRALELTGSSGMIRWTTMWRKLHQWSASPKKVRAFRNWMNG